MNILILSSANPYKTAGVVAKDLLEGLSNIPGNNAKLLVKVYDKYNDDDIESIEGYFQHYKKLISRKIKRLFVILKMLRDKAPNTDPNYYVLNYDQTITHYSTGKILNKIDFKPDVIIVLFMHNFLSFKNLFELNKETNAPVLLYLMDMAPMTGGCHYAWDCKKYLKNCGECPALYSTKHNDQSRVNFEFKKKYIEKTNVIPIAATEWQFRQLKKSSIFKNKKNYKVLLPIDENQYRPGDKIELRKELGLPKEKKIIFFGAVSVESKRKGVKELIESLIILKKNIDDPSQIHLAIAGNNIAKIEVLLPFAYTKLGYLDHNNLPKAFQAADVFVSPSIEDSGPMMVNQSIMCGTPVVAFEMGVALDLVHNNETGYKAKLKNMEDFAAGIESIIRLNQFDYNKMSTNCREFGLEHFSESIYISEFMRISNS